MYWPVNCQILKPKTKGNFKDATLFSFFHWNNKPNRSDAAKLSCVVFFVLEVTAALDTAKISSSVMVGNHMRKLNILFPTSASLELQNSIPSSQSECVRSTIHWFGIYFKFYWNAVRIASFANLASHKGLYRQKNLVSQICWKSGFYYMKQLSNSPLTVTVTLSLCPVPTVLLAAHL